MPTFELSDVREFIGPAALTSRCAETPPPTTTLKGTRPGHALYDDPAPGSEPPTLERSQRSRTATKRSVQWSQEKEKTKDRSTKVRRARARNANRGRGAKAPRKSHSRRIESSPEPTDTDGNTSEGTVYTKGAMELEANVETVVVQVPQGTHSSDDEPDYETLVYIPREKLLEELGATNPENYLHTCPDDELRTLLQRFRDYQLSGPSDYPQEKGSGDNQAAAMDVEEQHPQAAASPPGTTLLNVGGGHHLAYPPSKDPSVACSPGPSSRPANRRFNLSLSSAGNHPHLSGPRPTTTVPDPSLYARDLSVSPLHDYYRDVESQFVDTATVPEDTATVPEDTATVPENTATVPEDTAAEPMAIDPIGIELEARVDGREFVVDDPENPFILRPVIRPCPAGPPLSSRLSDGTVVPTSRPTSDGVQSRSGSQRAEGPQNNGLHPPTPLPLPARVHSNTPASRATLDGAHPVQPNSRPPNAPSSSPSLGGAPNGHSTFPNARPPPTLTSVGPAPTRVASAPVDIRPSSMRASSRTEMPGGRNLSESARALVSGPGPHRRSTSQAIARAARSPLGANIHSRRSSVRRTPLQASAQPNQPIVPIKVSSSMSLRVASAPVDCREMPSSLTLLLTEARGELGVVTQPEASSSQRNAGAQARPSVPNAEAEAEAARARADACVDMRGHRSSGEPSPTGSQAQAPRPTPTRAPAASNIMLDNDTERRAALAEQTGQYFNGRKQKPLARDVTGNARQVLVMAKLHLFIFVLLNGPYETRLTYLMWARAIFELTWRQQFPDLALEWPEVDVAEIMVNYLPTLRCKVKEELRSVLELFINFRNPVCNDEDLEYNQTLYKIIHPLGFYCVEWEPRTGHYQSEILPRAIAKAFFQGPHSIGVIFDHYFVGNRIPETMVCYILANLQFCIEEWSTGRFKAGDLGDGNMYHKNYSGAAYVAEVQFQPTLDPSEIRADTPPTEIDENESEA